MQLEKKVAQTLTRRHLTLSLAESCSGGLLAHRLTNIPGSSDFFLGGFITYSNEVKTQALGIPRSLLKKYGAVSKPVAQKMAQRVRARLKSDLGLSITGIAGPDGGTKQKPVGLVFIAAANKDCTLSMKCLLKGSRLCIKQQATSQALKLLLNLISKQE